MVGIACEDDSICKHVDEREGDSESYEVCNLK